MNRVGMKVLNEKKAELKKTAALESKDVQGRDLLTLLIKANMATDLPASQRLSDEDVVDRTWPIFFERARMLISGFQRFLRTLGSIS